MDKDTSIGTIEWLLKHRNYTENERNHIIDLTNKKWNTIYDKTERKFKSQTIFHQFGIILHKAYHVVIPDHEEENYAM